MVIWQLMLPLLIPAQPLPAVVSGSIQRFEFSSARLAAKRLVDVWLPKGYDSNRKYPVLYMHDGQMLFDRNMTWNHLSWDLDDVVAPLLTGGQLRPFIVVGIWNGGTSRHIDYFPQKPHAMLSKKDQGYVSAQLEAGGRSKGEFWPRSDDYLAFIVRELKPFIDSTFSTFRDRKHTCIAGSSMGGLISIYALCEYPDVFGGAACLSTHWPGIFTMEQNPVPAAFFDYLAAHLPPPRGHKIYFDCGDQTLDALYPPLQRQVDEMMQEKGYKPKQWTTQYFPGTDHSEQAWHERLDIPLKFLFK